MNASGKTNEIADRRWDRIVERFRSACVHYREGDKLESRRILKEELPPLIRSWMRPLPISLREEAKEDLRDMLVREQSIVDQGLKLQSAFKETLIHSIIPQVEEHVAAKYRKLYLSEQRERKLKRETEIHELWRQPANPSDAPANERSRKRVAIADVQEMIDSVQEEESDSETLADTVLSLEEIVGALKKAKSGPFLAEETAISI